MFGLSLGEIMLLLIVGIVVVGPKNLPSMMRAAGQWVSRLRRMSSDLRNQSGIDDLIRQEGLEKEIHELRSLSRMNVVDTLMTPALAAATSAAAPRPAYAPAKPPEFTRTEPLREREYPLVGCDAAGALADDAVPAAPAAPAVTAVEAAPDEAAALEDAAALEETAAPAPPPPEEKPEGASP